MHKQFWTNKVNDKCIIKHLKSNMDVENVYLQKNKGSCFLDSRPTDKHVHINPEQLRAELCLLWFYREGIMKCLIAVLACVLLAEGVIQ